MNLNTQDTEVADPQNKPTHPNLANASRSSKICRCTRMEPKQQWDAEPVSHCEQATVTQLANASRMVDTPIVCRALASRRPGVRPGSWEWMQRK
eukprot:9159856-Alexandrium_andersonii.AAC.1